jgi:hypothetical protein
MGSRKCPAGPCRASEHGIEEVDARLRAMMLWISKNRLVDTARKWD